MQSAASIPALELPSEVFAPEPQQVNIMSLHMAADCQLHGLVKQLLSRNPSDIGLQDDRGFVPFYLAGMKGSVELLTTLHEAALRHFGPDEGPKYTVRWAIPGNVSLLHHAALNDFAELAEWLVCRGAELEKFTNSVNGVPPFTPLMMACKWNCTRAACVLVNAGANVNVRVLDGHGGGDLTPLHITIQLGHMELAAFLFSRGASNTCTFGCIKCRLHSTMLKRRLGKMRLNIQARLATEALEAARQRECAEVMEELSFVDFVAEMRRIDEEAPCQAVESGQAKAGGGGGGGAAAVHGGTDGPAGGGGDGGGSSGRPQQGARKKGGKKKGAKKKGHKR